MGINKYYSNYRNLRKSLNNGTYDISFDSIGQINNLPYSTDITIRNYDNVLMLDYDVYNCSGEQPKYMDGGCICEISKMPLTEKLFWKMAEKKVNNFIKELA